jgi:hypothetical protein
MPKTQLQKSRQAAFNRQGGRCYYCPAEMWLADKETFASKHTLSMEDATGFRCTAEHLKAKSEGGTDGQQNVVAACDVCNKLRHHVHQARSPKRHKAFVDRTSRHYILVDRLFGDKPGSPLSRG